MRWIGLDEERFARYRDWLNATRPGICGTYCCAVLIHDMILTTRGVSLNKDVLLNGLKALVDYRRWYIGTFAGDLVHGLQQVLPTVTVRRRVQVLDQVKALCEQERPQPCIVGTLSLFGSSYGNHWLVAYAYAIDDDGEYYVKCYDNHGRHDAVVPVKTLCNCIWLEHVY